MTLIRLNRSLCLIALVCASGFVLSQQHQRTRKAAAAVTTEDRAIFAASCASCHGLDGLGTQRAPNIVTAARVQQLSSQQMLRIVSDGIPAAGMPAFRSLGDEKLKSVVRYVKGLQGNVGQPSLPGDPIQGKQIFAGSGTCSSCHTVAGSGGFIAADLTSYALTHSADQIRAAIIKPDEGNSAKGLVTATSTDGRQYQGIVRSEDNFSLQLQALDGAFYFLSKSELQRIDRTPVASMHADYGSKLNPDQLNDIVSYLLSVAKNSVPADARKDED